MAFPGLGQKGGRITGVSVENAKSLKDARKGIADSCEERTRTAE